MNTKVVNIHKKWNLFRTNDYSLFFSITNLQAFKCLKTLSLGRNNLKSLQGIEASSETLEQLWISYNQVSNKAIATYLKWKMKGEF